MVRKSRHRYRIAGGEEDEKEETKKKGTYLPQKTIPFNTIQLHVVLCNVSNDVRVGMGGGGVEECCRKTYKDRRVEHKVL